MKHKKKLNGVFDYYGGREEEIVVGSVVRGSKKIA
jgi:hypothetical protein